ncbi:MAG: CPBP family intramembrane metalloprotease [Bacteroidales bacterium]|nr:CPBP family intramembrane metalloprotease [Candidatus Equibacterium intestinale]
MRYYLPDWGQSLLLVLVFLAGSIASSVLSLAGVESLSAVYAVSMLFPLGYALIRSWQAGRSGLCGYVLMDDFRKGGFRCKAAPLLLAVCMVPCATLLLEPAASLIPMSDALRQIFEKMFDTSRPVDLFVSTAILAPLCEETLCRGIICRGMLSRHKPAVAILWSAFIFALMHGNLSQGVMAFSLGILLGWVYYKTHSLWCTIAMHFTNNALSVALMYLFPDLPMDATYADVLPQNIYIFALVAAALVLAACIYLINSKIDNEKALSFEVCSPSGGEEMGR